MEHLWKSVYNKLYFLVQNSCCYLRGRPIVMDLTRKGGQDGPGEGHGDDPADPPTAPRSGIEGAEEVEDPTVPSPQEQLAPAPSAAAAAEGGGGRASAAPSTGGHAVVAAEGVVTAVHPSRPPQTTTTTVAKSQGFGGAAGSAPSSFQFTFGAGTSGGAAKVRLGRGWGGNTRVFAMQRH